MKVLLVSDEQLQHVQLNPAKIAAWPSLQLLDVQRSSHSQLLAALQTVCNLRRSDNLWGFLPEGLPSEYYDMRSDVRRKVQTSYLLVQPSDSLGEKNGSEMPLRNLTSLANGPTAQEQPLSYNSNAAAGCQRPNNGNIAIIVTRSASSICSERQF